MRCAGIIGATAWALALATVPGEAQAREQAAEIADRADGLRALFAAAMQADQVPGMAYGIVRNGELVLVEAMGVRDLDSRRPVDADTRFRIASMSKAFTALAILKLRDEGVLELDAPASRYVPEMAGWTWPTADSAPILVGDLLRHSGGLVEDNPWGDRQQVLTDDEFGALIAGGMDFATTPGLRFEYSNYGFALLGRIVTNVSGRRYQDYIREEIMLPLGMDSTGYDVLADPPGSRAIGYRWQDEGWLREPDMRDGAFGAMGGVETTARDYARWIAFLLSAWPPSDAPEAGPARRSSVREMVKWLTLSGSSDRSPELGEPCRLTTLYGMGLRVTMDCELGRVISHTGGYPGYGSAMQLMPEAGVGMFAFNSRTYYSGALTVTKALLTLRRAGLVPDRELPVADGLARSYAIARQVWESGDPADAPLANNMGLDRDLAHRRADIAALKQEMGDCETEAPIVAISAMEGRFTWQCEHGAVRGHVQRAPVTGFLLQRLDFAAAGEQ